jgi:hypothetical protein
MADEAGGPMHEEAREPGRGPAILAACSILVLVLDGIGMLFLVFGLVYVVPRFEQIFAEIEVVLPGVTRLALTVPPAVQAGAFMLLFGVLVLKEVLVGSARVRLRLNLAAGAVTVFAFAVYWLAFYMPMMKIMEAVNR